MKEEKEVSQVHTVGQQINIELGEKEAEGVYANFAVISHSPSEFVIDFARILPGLAKAKVYARVIMSPYNFKVLARAIEDNIKKYEERFGEIKVPGEKERSIGFTVG
ncbi:MAG: DUF3467 domain-containing protein [bacterium]